MKNYYRILELPLNASPRRIKEQYRKLAKRYHPDRLTDPANKAYFEEKFKEINRAYEALSEIVKRGNLNPKERKLDFLYEQGKRLFNQNKWSRAMIIFNEILAIDLTYRDTHTWLREARRKHKRLAAMYAEADRFYQHRQWSEAIDHFNAVLRQDPNYRDAAKKLKNARREQLMEEFISQS